MDTLHSFTLQEVIQETVDVKTFVFTPQDPSFTWMAGQYLDWQLPHENADDRGQRRWFSIASAQSEGKVLLSCRFAEDGSTLKKRLLQLVPGDVVQAKGPEGHFTLPEVSRETVLVAGGIGITPFRAILKDLESKGGISSLTLVHGNRTAENVPFGSELQQLTETQPGFTYVQTFSPTVIDADLLAGYYSNVAATDFMISGLEKMVESIKHSLISAGVPEEQIRIDDFGGYDYHLDKPIY